MLEDFVDKDLPPEEQWSSLYGRVLSSANVIEPNRELYQQYRRYRYQSDSYYNRELLRPGEAPTETQMNSYEEFVQNIREWKQFIETLDMYNWGSIDDAIDWLGYIERVKQGHTQSQVELNDALDEIAERFQEFLDNSENPDEQE